MSCEFSVSSEIGYLDSDGSVSPETREASAGELAMREVALQTIGQSDLAIRQPTRQLSGLVSGKIKPVDVAEMVPNRRGRFQLAVTYFSTHPINPENVAKFDLTDEEKCHLPFAVMVHSGSFPPKFIRSAFPSHTRFAEVARVMDSGTTEECIREMGKIMQEAGWSENILSSIRKIFHLNYAREVISFLLYFLFLSQTGMRIDWVLKNEILERLISIRSQKARMIALGSLGAICSQRTETQERLLRTHNNSLLGLRIISHYVSLMGFDVSRLIDSLNKRFRSDETKLVDLIEGIDVIYTEYSLPDPIRDKIIEILCEDLSQLCLRLEYLYSILALGGKELLTLETLERRKYEEVLIKAIESEFSASSVEINYAKVFQLFQNFKIPRAFFVYLGRLTKLKDPSIAPFLHKLFVVLSSDSLDEMRYNSVHLQQMDRKLVDRWRQPSSSVPIEELISQELRSRPDTSLDLDGAILCKKNDLEGLFSCGTMVDTCLKYDGNPVYSKGLLGIIAHGQTQIIVVEDKSGNCLARAIIRLMLDNRNKPVLFLEEAYLNVYDERLSSAVDEMAKKIASELKLTLLAERNTGAKYGMIYSFGGEAPYEYSDASGCGAAPKGHFSITEARIIFPVIEL